jgi:transposase-like protein
MWRMTSSPERACHSAVFFGRSRFFVRFFGFLAMANAPLVPSQTYVRKYPTKYQKAHTNLLDVVARFGSEDVCRDYLEKLRWPDGQAICPRCESPATVAVPSRHQYDCLTCSFRFSVTSGTLFDNTKLPLWKWFAAIYLMIESKKSMSANQIKRTIGTTYKTSWYLCHRIREAMETFDEGPALFGIIELDETLLKPRKRHVEHLRDGFKRGGGGMGPADKRVWVAGAIQRGTGQVRLRHIKNIKKETIHEFVRSVAKDETEAFYTDELKSYLGIADHNTRHETVNHAREEWVVGDVHTNSIEGVWGLFKRSIVGAFHKISVKHLDAYLQEQEFRINNRDNQHAFRDIMKRIMWKPALRYSALTAADHPKSA